jgi:glutamyl/glutaminyl-tRNA synthetase
MTTIKERTEIARENKRNVPAILSEIEMLATLSSEVALSCFYVVFNKEDNKPFVGISVRFAELIASCWGNIHTGAKITKNNGMSVTIQGFVHDFEKNAVFTVEVQRSLGRMSSERAMQTTNAASSIAFRNAIFKAIPAAITSKVAKNIKHYITHNVDGDSIIKEVIKYFKTKGIEYTDINRVFGESFLKDINSENVFLLIGLKNAIEEGDTTISEVFGKGEVNKLQRSSKFNFASEDDLEDESELKVVSQSEGRMDRDTGVVKKIVEPTLEDKKDLKPNPNFELGNIGSVDKVDNVPLHKVSDESEKLDSGFVEDKKVDLKNGLSHLAEKPKLKIAEEVIGDIPKEETKKKRGRGRPSKKQS